MNGYDHLEEAADLKKDSEKEDPENGNLWSRRVDRGGNEGHSGLD